MANEKDLYAVLGVPRGASAAEVRKAYRKLARQHHPDVNPGDKAAEERFKEVTAAHEVLSNPDKRALYDEFGEVGLREGFKPEEARAYQRYAAQGGGGQPFGGAHPFGGTAGGGDVFEFNLGDMLGDLFGGGGGRAARGPTRGRGVDHTAVVEVDFLEALRGTEVRMQGEPGTPPFTVRLPPGIDNGSKLRVPGRGGKGRAGAPDGDLVIEARVRPHPYFRREGLDLYLRLPVTVDEVYNGATVEVPTPAGPVNLRIPPRSQQGKRMRLRGKGVSRGNTTGDLYVDLDVRVPDIEDAAVSEAMQVLSRAYSHPVREDVRL